jgi:hypothetical protein
LREGRIEEDDLARLFRNEYGIRYSDEVAVRVAALKAIAESVVGWSWLDGLSDALAFSTSHLMIHLFAALKRGYSESAEGADGWAVCQGGGFTASAEGAQSRYVGCFWK